MDLVRSLPGMMSFMLTSLGVGFAKQKKQSSFEAFV